MKKCSKCKKRKPVGAFHWQNKKLRKRMAACAECNLERQRVFRKNNPDLQKKNDRASYQKNKKHRVVYARRYRIENPDKTRATNLKVKYGITIEEYDLLKGSQKSRCGICNVHENNLKKRLVVDHCHSTNKIRGLLCDTCNRFLGFYEKLNIQCESYLNEQ